MLDHLALIGAGLLLFAGHVLPSAPGVRPRLIAALGRRRFLILHSLGSLLALALLILAYRNLDGSLFIYAPLPGSAALAVLLMPFAFVLVAYRLATPFGEAAAPPPPRGIYRICRFPGSVGLLLWSLLHLMATGDSRRVIVFATFGAIALYALIKNERVLRRAGSAEAGRFHAETSLLPGWAILTGRQRWPRGELDWRPAVLGLLSYLVLLWLHPWLFGVDPLWWLPGVP